MNNITCEKCGADLNNKKIVWLYYNRMDNSYSSTIESDEQFPFGSDCAKKLDKNPAAIAMGILGGQAKSSKKAQSSRLNGLKGGRPVICPVCKRRVGKDKNGEIFLHGTIGFSCNGKPKKVLPN